MADKCRFDVFFFVGAISRSADLMFAMELFHRKVSSKIHTSKDSEVKGMGLNS